MARSGESIDHRAGAAEPRRRFLWFQAVPAWLVSMLVHMLLLILLALITVAEPREVISVMSATNVADAEPRIEEFTLAEVDPGELAEAEANLAQPVAAPSPLDQTEMPEVAQPVPLVAVAPERMDIMDTIAPTQSLLQPLSEAVSQNLTSRGGAKKRQLLKRFGGTEASEAAVARALRWLAIHQLPNGAWTFNHAVVCRGRDGCTGVGDSARASAFNAATALGVLPFLGAGQTHLEGEYKETVRRGLWFLIQNGRPTTIAGLPCLDLSEDGGNHYSHGLAAIALCEAYAMTGDPALLVPAQQSLNYIVAVQDPRSGGWRYAPRQTGDTSVTGWQVMALKSGHMAHLVVPPQSIVGANGFLNLVSVNEGVQYRYEPTSPGPSDSCQAIGLLCRMYLGWDKSHPAMVEGVKAIAERGPAKNDIYYNYYAAQVLRHYGGAEWEAFNRETREWLIASQVTEGHAAGSWHWPDSLQHRGPIEGGRLCSTSFATMILEVYYRYMPLYADAAAEDDFPL